MGITDLIWVKVTISRVILCEFAVFFNVLQIIQAYSRRCLNAEHRARFHQGEGNCIWTLSRCQVWCKTDVDSVQPTLSIQCMSTLILYRNHQMATEKVFIQDVIVVSTAGFFFFCGTTSLSTLIYKFLAKNIELTVPDHVRSQSGN